MATAMMSLRKLICDVCEHVAARAQSLDVWQIQCIAHIFEFESLVLK